MQKATLWNRFWCLVYGHDYDGPTGLLRTTRLLAYLAAIPNSSKIAQVVSYIRAAGK